MQKVSIFFFSGTGGTEKAALRLAESLAARNAEIELVPLSVPLYPDEASRYTTETPVSISDHETRDKSIKAASEKAESLLLLYPVYALDAPWPVYDWIETLSGRRRPMGVISVSGGGDFSINRNCMEACSRSLEKKGFNLVFEKMLVMPVNLITPTPKDLACRLLRVLPERAGKAAEEFLEAVRAGIPRTPGKMSHLRFLSMLEKQGSHRFARRFRIDENCNGCGWCSMNCPTGNISLLPETGKPLFGKECSLCLRCIYGCPEGAIRSGTLAVLNDGFNLKTLEKELDGREPAPLEECGKGWLWRGVVDYLKEK